MGYPLHSEHLFIHHRRGDLFTVDAHDVLVDFHVADQEEVLEVSSAVSSTKMSIRDDAVKVDLCIQETDSRRANVLVSI